MDGLKEDQLTILNASLTLTLTLLINNPKKNCFEGTNWVAEHDNFVYGFKKVHPHLHLKGTLFFINISHDTTE